ncbi:hypothetical protein HZB03_03285 [Candidatus Woesearchaeota archaeon]|nr:hypothetical protein [Candidatus Woesearchaeota archaeon]
MAGKFRCANCNYRFEYKREGDPRSCPYCSKVGSLRREASASDVLRAVENMPDR